MTVKQKAFLYFATVGKCSVSYHRTLSNCSKPSVMLQSFSIQPVAASIVILYHRQSPSTVILHIGNFFRL